MLHAIIIDDEPSGLRSLELLLEKFVPGVKLVAQTTSGTEGIKLINNYRPDIVFLDIYMPGLNGFDLLEKLEFRNFHLIFTTAYEEYALKAIKQSATDYLLKPVDPEDLKNAVTKVMQKKKEKENAPDIFKLTKEITELTEKQSTKIALPGKNGIQFVAPEDITYIEANSNHSIVTLSNDNTVTVTKALKDYEAQLCTKNSTFIRIHNSFIINFNYVTKYLKEDGGYAVIKNKKNIPLSKNKKEEFLKLIGVIRG